MCKAQICLLCRFVPIVSRYRESMNTRNRLLSKLWSLAFSVITQSINGVTILQPDGILFINMYWPLKRLEIGPSLWNIFVYAISFVSDEAREVIRAVTEDPWLNVSYLGAHFKNYLRSFPWRLLLLLCHSSMLLSLLSTLDIQLCVATAENLSMFSQ